MSTSAYARYSARLSSYGDRYDTTIRELKSIHGFYCSDGRDVCFGCQFQPTSPSPWEDVGDVFDHMEKNSACIALRSILSVRETRIATISQWKTYISLCDVDCIADAYYYWNRHEGLIKCCYCNAVWDPFSVDLKGSLRIHCAINMGCPAVLGTLGLDLKQAHCNDIKDLEKTYTYWPGISTSIDELVKAGFYYAQIDKYVVCHSCKLKIRIEDDLIESVLSLHNNANPYCPFISSILNS